MFGATMTGFWVLAAVLVWAEAGLAAHHRDTTGSVFSRMTSNGHRRSLHTTEGHGHPEPQGKPDLPVALPQVAGHQKQLVPISLEALKPTKATPASPPKDGARRKREPNRSDLPVASSSAVLGELGKILKDDDSEKKRIPPVVKREVNNELNHTQDDGNEKQQQSFQDWLKDEYVRNMAQSIATAKRKRSSLEARRKRSSRRDDATGAAEEAKTRLQALEDAVLSDALSEILSREDGSSGPESESDGEQVALRLAQAYYLEKLRGAVQRIEKEAENRETWGVFDEEAGEGDEIQSSDDEYLPYQKRDTCPALRMITSDCSGLEEMLGEDELSTAVRQACNKHEVCYTCGEVFGLSSGSCDRVFLSDVKSACRSCSERALKHLLVPLREQRVFYKRSVPPVCYKAPCVQHYLEEHY